MNDTQFGWIQANMPDSEAGKARSPIEQAGALCIRSNGGRTDVLLVGSLRTGKWGIPKGHIEPNEPSWTAAERECFEEAGIEGVAGRYPIGSFVYSKPVGTGLYLVRVHLVEMCRSLPDYPEKNMRKTFWVPLEAASRLVGRHGLRRILRQHAKLRQIPPAGPEPISNATPGGSGASADHRH